MLDCKNIHARYGRIEVLSGIDLQVSEGEIVCLLGANGAGKSTLLGVLTQSNSAHAAGSAQFLGQNLLRMSSESIVGAGIALSPEGRQLFAELTVDENIRLGAYLRRDRAGITHDYDTVLELFPRLRERRKQLAGTLSGGEQQMVAIGRALMSRPKLLLLDEPSLGLAPLLVREIMTLIQRINTTGVSILLVEQNAQQALGIADRAYLLERGKIADSGLAADFRDNNRIARAYLGGNSPSTTETSQ